MNVNKIKMKTIFDINNINIAIKNYNPEKIIINKYSSSLKRLLLFLYNKNSKEVMYIISIGCSFIRANFSWANPSLSVSYNQNTQEFILEDSKNNFMIISSGGIILFEGEIDEFRNIFDNWESNNIPNY